MPRGGRGSQYATVYFGMPEAGRRFEPFYLYEAYRAASFSVYLSDLRELISDETLEQEMEERLGRLGFDTSPKAAYPGVSVVALTSDEGWLGFVEVMEWLLEVIREQLQLKRT